LNFTSFNPIQALFWSAVINGIVSAPVMVLMMLLTANTKVMGQFTVTGVLRFAGWLATAVMGGDCRNLHAKRRGPRARGDQAH